MSDWLMTTDKNLLCPDCNIGLIRDSNIEHCRMLDSDTGNRCCKTFNGLSTLDAHRVGNRAIWQGPDRFRCLSNDELIAIGFKINDQGRWVRPLSLSDRERLAVAGHLSQSQHEPTEADSPL